MLLESTTKTVLQISLLLSSKNIIFCFQTAGIEVRVTKELPGRTVGESDTRDDVPQWMATSAPNPASPPSPTSPTTPTNPRQYLSPHVFQGRNSLCSANGKILPVGG